jgi:transposase
MHLKPGSDRNVMYVTCLDEFIRPDSPVRALDYIVEEAFSHSTFKTKRGNNKTGQRAYSPKDLVKLHLYGYLNGYTSSRQLQHLAEVNIEVRWLLRENMPSYKTIADFRKDNGDLFRSIFFMLVQLLKEEGFIKNRMWVLDGHKVKANARKEVQSMKTLKRQILELESEIESLVASLPSKTQTPADDFEKQSETDDHEPPASSGSAKDTYERLLQSQKELEDTKQLVKICEEKGQNFISPTDTDAILLCTRRGTKPAYNTQVVVDSEHHLITGVQLSHDANDRNSLYSSIQNVCFETGTFPEIVLADAGYHNQQDIAKLHKRITNQIYVPLRKTQTEKNDLVFTYDKEQDIVICPLGNKMTKHREKVSAGTTYSVYKCYDCANCKLQPICVPKAQCRESHVSEYHEIMEQMHLKMRTAEATKILRSRKGIIEHVFGTIDYLMHFNGFKLRGNAKVMIEMYIYCTAYNLKRLFNLRRIRPLNNGRGIISQFCKFYFFLYCIIVKSMITGQKPVHSVVFSNRKMQPLQFSEI